MQVDGLTTMSITPEEERPWSVFAYPASSGVTKHDGLPWTTLPTGGEPAMKPSLGAMLDSLSKPEKQVKAPRMDSPQQWFLVYSFNAKFPYEGPTYKFYQLFRTKEEANVHVRHVFYEQNPWGWKREDFEHGRYHTPVKTKQQDGLLSLAIDEEEEWKVHAIPLPPGSEAPADDPTAAVVIHSAFGYLPDGFHAPERQTMKIESVMPSKEAANARVKEIFTKNHSYGWSIEDMTSGEVGSGTDIEKKYRHGLLRLSIHPNDDESWSVQAQAIKKPKSEFRAMGEYYIPDWRHALSDDE